jgi:hypothetical protein
LDTRCGELHSASPAKGLTIRRIDGTPPALFRHRPLSFDFFEEAFMVNFARLFNLHTGAVLAVTLGFAGGAGIAVATDVNFDEFEKYETAFMAACTGWNAPRTCYCAMASMEDQLGFEEFARATQRTQGNVFNDSRWDRAAFRAVENCSAMASPATD